MSEEISSISIKANTAYEITSDPDKEMGGGVILKVENPEINNLSDEEITFILSSIGKNKIDNWISNQKSEDETEAQ